MDEQSKGFRINLHHAFLLLDGSASMRETERFSGKPKHKAVAEMVQELINELHDNPSINNSWLTVICYDSNKVDDIRLLNYDVKTESHYNQTNLDLWDPIIGHAGMTPIGRALGVGYDLAKKWIDSAEGLEIRRAVIYLLSDGMNYPDTESNGKIEKQKIEDFNEQNSNKGRIRIATVGYYQNSSISNVEEDKGRELLISLANNPHAYFETANAFEISDYVARTIYRGTSTHIDNFLSTSRLNQTTPKTNTSAKPLEQLLEIQGAQTALNTEIQVSLISPKNQRLTPEYLANDLSTYLIAIANIQKIVNEIKGRDQNGIYINSITQKSPIGISLEGVPESIQLLLEHIIPSKREHIEKMEYYARKEKQYEIERRRIELQESNLRVIREGKELERASVEIEKMKAEAEKLRIENARALLELKNAEAQLALNILKQIAPSLSEAQRAAYLVRLLPSIAVISSSEIEVTRKK